jgi:hypothetical protein
MVLHEDYEALVPRMESLLEELDRLELSIVAVHVDFALQRLQEVITGIVADDNTKLR